MQINGGNNSNNSGGGLSLNRGGAAPQQPLQGGGGAGPVVSLAKGDRVSLVKNDGTPLDLVHVGLGWDTQRFDGADFDLDVQVFLLGENGKVRSNADFIFYNQPKDATGSVVHNGDNRTGAGDGDDESVTLTLSKVPAYVDKIAFTVTIHEALQRGQSFGQVSNAFIRVEDKGNGKEMIRFDLTEDHSGKTSMVVAEIYRKNGEWKFNAVGDGFNTDLAGFCNKFGVVI